MASVYLPGLPWRSTRLQLDAGHPVSVLGCAAPHARLESLLQARRDRAALAAADLPAIDRCHPGDLHTGAAQEDLIGDVQLGPVDLALYHRDAEIAGQLEDGPAVDPLQDVAGHRRRDQFAVAH